MKILTPREEAEVTLDFLTRALVQSQRLPLNPYRCREEGALKEVISLTRVFLESLKDEH